MANHGHGRGHSHGHGMTEVLLKESDKELGMRESDGAATWKIVASASDITRVQVSKHNTALRVLVVVDVLTTIFILWGGVCGFNWENFGPQLVDNYGGYPSAAQPPKNISLGGALAYNHYESLAPGRVSFHVRNSMIDVLVITAVKYVCMLALCFFIPALCLDSGAPDSVGNGSKLYRKELLQDILPRIVPDHVPVNIWQSVAWWCIFSISMLSLTKAGMWQYGDGYSTSHPYKTAAVVVVAVMSILEVRLSHLLLESQQRGFDLDKLLLSDLAALRKLKSDYNSQHHGSSESKQRQDKSEKSEEDPRSRFYDDPEKIRLELLSATGVQVNGEKRRPSNLLQEVVVYWTIMKPYFWPNGLTSKVRILFTFLIMIGSKLCSILSPIFIGQAVQRLSDSGEIPVLEITLYASLKFLSVGLQQLQKIVYLGVKQHAFSEIATTTFRHLHNLSLDWHLQKKMGQVLRIMDRGISSADSVMNYLVLYLFPSIVQAIIVFAIFYIKFSSAELAGVSFLSFVAYVVVTIKITMWRKKFRKATNRHDNKYHDLATDSLVNFETVKYFANEEYEIGRFQDTVQQYQKHNIATQASLAVLNSAQQLDIQATALIALMISASSILHHTTRLDGVDGASSKSTTKIGDFVSVNAYLLQLYAPLSFLGTIYSTVVQAFVDMGNLSDLLVVSPDVKDSPSARPLRLLNTGSNVKRGAKIEFRNVSFHYPSQPTKGVEGLSFIVEAGTTTAFVGPTGAGKSTVSRLLFRFYDVDSGEILVDGQNIADVTQKSLRSAIGVVPQDTVLFNSTLRENIQYGRIGAPHSMLENAARSAQVLDFINSLEDGWETSVGERGLKISGGEKQRVAIARCLLKDPPIVALDEATSALDSTTEVAVQEALNRLGQGRTQVVIAHRLSTIMKADQICVLRSGRIVERGTHSELLARKQMYYNLWNAQQETQPETEGSS